MIFKGITLKRVVPFFVLLCHSAAEVVVFSSLLYVIPMSRPNHYVMLGTMRLDGFGLIVRDLGAMVRFYRDVLGFEVRECEDTKSVYLIKDGLLFLLRESGTDEPAGYAPGLAGHVEIALTADGFEDVDRQYARARTGRGVRARAGDRKLGAARLPHRRSGRQSDRDRRVRRRG